MNTKRAELDVVWGFDEVLLPRANQIMVDLLDEVLRWSSVSWDKAERQAKQDKLTIALANSVCESRRHGVFLFMYITFERMKDEMKPTEMCVWVCTTKAEALSFREEYLDEVHQLLGSPEGATKH